MSYSISRRGVGEEPGCPPGEEFDLTSMQCVTAGQAETPIPAIPSVSLPTIQVPTQAPAHNGGTVQPAPSAPVSTTGKSVMDALPWVAAGAVVVGLGVLLSSGGRK